MKMNAIEHNKQVLEHFFKDTASRNMISIAEASELNHEYLVTHDKAIKEKILLGVQHLIFTTLNTLDLDLKDQTIIDYEDVISYLNVYFAEEIEKGLFCDARVLSDIITNKLIIDLLSYVQEGSFKIDEVPIQTQKETAVYDPEITTIMDPTINVKKREAIATLLNELYENDNLITKEMYERFYLGESSYNPNRLRTADIFLTDKFSDGALLKVVNSHPLYADIRSKISKLM